MSIWVGFMVITMYHHRSEIQHAPQPDIPTNRNSLRWKRVVTLTRTAPLHRSTIFRIIHLHPTGANMATQSVNPIPEGMHTVTPHLVCAGAGAAIDFYKKAFGATETPQMPGPGDN